MKFISNEKTSPYTKYCGTKSRKEQNSNSINSEGAIGTDMFERVNELLTHCALGWREEFHIQILHFLYWNIFMAMQSTDFIH